MILRFTLVAVLTFESSSTHTAKSLVGKTALTGGVVLAMVFNACALKPKRRNMYHHDENKLVGNWLFSDLFLSFEFIRLIDKTKLETKGCLVCYTVTMIMMIMMKIMMWWKCDDNDNSNENVSDNYNDNDDDNLVDDKIDDAIY